MSKKVSLSGVVLTIVSILLAFLFLLPIIWSLAASFKVEGSHIATAWDWFLPPYTIGNYQHVITKSAVPTWLYNSILIAVITTIVGVLVTAMAAYAIAKIPFRGKNMFYFYFLLGMMVPGEATIVPLFITANGLNLIDTYAGMILPAIAGSMNLIIMITFMRNVPNELIEAAEIDGASFVRIFFYLMLPLSKTILVTTSIFTFMGSWNNYLWPLLCAMSEQMFTLPIGIPTFSGTYTVDYVMPMTAAMVASLPAIALFLLFERQIVQGVALSGIKG